MALAAGITVLAGGIELVSSQASGSLFLLADAVHLLAHLGIFLVLLIPPGRLHGATASSEGDHRMAMTLAVAGSIASGETTVSGSEAAAVSYPAFFEQLAAVSE